MKDYKRLRVGVEMFNSPNGFVVLDLKEYDGGDFELHPKLTEDGALVLVDPNRPATYALQIQGEPEALKRFANALRKLADGGASDSDDTADAE